MLYVLCVSFGRSVGWLDFDHLCLSLTHSSHRLFGIVRKKRFVSFIVRLFSLAHTAAYAFGSRKSKEVDVSVAFVSHTTFFRRIFKKTKDTKIQSLLFFSVLPPFLQSIGTSQPINQATYQHRSIVSVLFVLSACV